MGPPQPIGKPGSASCNRLPPFTQQKCRKPIPGPCQDAFGSYSGAFSFSAATVGQISSSTCGLCVHDTGQQCLCQSPFQRFSSAVPVGLRFGQSDAILNRQVGRTYVFANMVPALLASPPSTISLRFEWVSNPEITAQCPSGTRMHTENRRCTHEGNAHSASHVPSKDAAFPEPGARLYRGRSGA